MSSNNKNVISLKKDYFIQRDGVYYAGTHLLVDLWGAKQLTNLQFIDASLRHCISACHATLLHIHLHQFNSSGGISGVAVLAESHISVHTWPERDYAAFDIFMCGASTPENAIPVLQRAFAPQRLEVKEMLRGKVTE